MKYLTNTVAFAANQQDIIEPFQSLTHFPVVIMVGLTGVGKTTLINRLVKKINPVLLPNRREVTDEIMIASLQQQDGDLPEVVTDRIKRFEYTARYRAKYPGGMAHALSRLAICPVEGETFIFFDGLRGLNEVEFAVTYFPQARFVVLDAPDMVRLSRLLNRADAFDAVSVQPPTGHEDLVTALAVIPDIQTVFNQTEWQQIARLAVDTSAEDIIKKATIIVTERRNYDSQAAGQYLTGRLSDKQLFLVDTATQSPDEMVNQISEWLG